jgi:hypothetical protein
MCKRIFLSLVASALSLAVLATVAHAAVPGWARKERTTRLDVFNCADQARIAVQSVTGVAPIFTKFDANTYEVRGFTGSVGIFAYCTAAPVTICNRPKGNLIILTFSSVSSTDAAAKRDAVNAAFGDPLLIDCNQ